MWKIRRLIVLSSVLLLFIGCQKMEQRHNQIKAWMEDNGAIKVLCTTEYVVSLVRSVGGEAVDVLSLVNGSNDPHSYQLVKGDNEKFLRSDLVFSTGLGLEMGASLARYLALYNAIAIGDYIAHETQQAIFVGPTVDPHMWMDISLWAQGVDVIAQQLTAIRPDVSEYFKKNAFDTKNRLMEVHEKIRTLLHTVPPEHRYLVTTHDAFHYFCRAYLAEQKEQQSGEWSKRCIAPEGFAPESQISTHDLDTVISYIIQHHISEVFVESEMNEDSVKKIIDVCRERGQDVTLSDEALYSDTIDGTYEKTIEHNAEVITRALMRGVEDQ